MSEPDEIVEHKVRRAAKVSALRKIGRIVSEEQKTDAEDARTVRWFLRYGWLVALVVALLWAYWAGVI